MRFGWVIKSAAVGLVAMLLVCYIFSVAYSISSRQTQMLVKLGNSGDHTFDYALGSGDIMWLAALGALITLFAGGMAATLLPHHDLAAKGKWIISSAVVAIITMLVIDGYVLATWNDGVQKWHKSPVDEYGRPFEPAVFPAILFLLIVIDGACLLASAAGGLVVSVSPLPGASKN